MATDRELLQGWWSDAWREGLWAASWEKSREGLTPAQAAWSPAPGRHSIWQMVMHMVFWREDALRRLTDPTKPTAEQLWIGNFPVVGDVTPAAWDDVRARFAATQRKISEAIALSGTDLSRLQYMLPHDCYHFGQINLLRALQGLPPIE